jgi:hypothetical protein
MFHASIHILTIAAMFGHALLGCCCHHAHGSSAGCRHFPEAVEGIRHDGDGPDHQHAAVDHREACDQSPTDGTHDDGRPDDHRPCDEKRCTYVVTKQAEMNGLTMTAAHWAMPVPMASLPPQDAGWRQSAGDHSSFSAPQFCAVLGVFRL